MAPWMLLMGLTALLLPACKTTNEIPANEEMFNEGSVATVHIGSQTWMAENLRVTMDSAGNPVDAVAYDFDPELAARYGRLYTFDQAIQACPPGWHLPTMQEWQELFDHLGGMEVAGGKMKTVDGWEPPNVGASNSSGFSARPAGGAGNANQFDGLGFAAHFWSASIEGDSAPVPSLMNSQENAYVLHLNRAMKASVRYVRN